MSAPPTTAHYSPAEVTLIVAGVDVNTGFADGTFVSLKRNSKTFGSKVGACGDFARVRKLDGSATVMITLLQTSQANARLSALATLDENGTNGAGVGPFLMRDRGGTSLHAGESCWVSDRPEIQYGDEITNRVWEITIARVSPTSIDGGN